MILEYQPQNVIISNSYNCIENASISFLTVIETFNGDGRVHVCVSLRVYEY